MLNCRRYGLYRRVPDNRACFLPLLSWTSSFLFKLFFFSFFLSFPFKYNFPFLSFLPFFFLCLFHFFMSLVDLDLLWTPGLPHTHYLTHADTEFSNPPASSSHMLRDYHSALPYPAPVRCHQPWFTTGSSLLSLSLLLHVCNPTEPCSEIHGGRPGLSIRDAGPLVHSLVVRKTEWHPSQNWPH